MDLRSQITGNVERKFYIRKFRPGRVKRWIFRICVILYSSLLIFAVFNFKSRVIVTYPDYLFEDNKENLCRLNSSRLAPVWLDMFEYPPMELTQEKNAEVMKGGWWKPKGCKVRQKVAIIVPYRDRFEHLKQFLARLHPMLIKQMAYYRIFIIEQDSRSKFNRGRLLNIGVAESIKLDNFDCFVFHDVDLLPEDDRNIYHCDQNAHHLISAVNEMRYHIMYYNYLGGVLSINKENVYKANGHSNDYWGWGSEDDDFNARTIEIGLQLSRPPEHIGRYKMARHAKLWSENRGTELFLTWRSRWKYDGLNNLDEKKYRVLSIVEHPLYTNISVDVGPSPAMVTPDPQAPFESGLWYLSYFLP